MLPKKFRFSNFTEVEKVKNKGKLFQFPFFGALVLFRKNQENPRFAFIVSLKISKKATERNRIKRFLSEGIRSFLPKIAPGTDVVFLAKKSIINKSFLEIKREIEIFLKKGGLIINEK